MKEKTKWFAAYSSREAGFYSQSGHTKDSIVLFAASLLGAQHKREVQRNKSMLSTDGLRSFMIEIGTGPSFETDLHEVCFKHQASIPYLHFFSEKVCS